MSGPLELLSPEVEELLRELAQDPESTLLRVERPRELQDLSTRRADVSARSAGWTSAERHLLECHREEVAFLLRYLYYIRFVSSERQVALRELRLRHAFRGVRPDEDLLRSHIARHAGILRREHPSDPTTALVEDCLDLTRDPSAAPMQLAAVSLRLVPSEAGRGYMGMEYMQLAHSRSALRVFQSLLREACASERASYALSYIAETYERTSRVDLALHFYLQAYRVSGNHESLLSAFGAAARLRDAVRVREIGALLESQLSTSGDVVDAWCRFVEGRSVLSRHQPAAEDITLGMLAPDELSETPRRILSALV